jgi:hypothetical protein
MLAMRSRPRKCLSHTVLRCALPIEPADGALLVEPFAPCCTPKVTSRCVVDCAFLLSSTVSPLAVSSALLTCSHVIVRDRVQHNSSCCRSLAQGLPVSRDQSICHGASPRSPPAVCMYKALLGRVHLLRTLSRLGFDIDATHTLAGFRATWMAKFQGLT